MNTFTLGPLKVTVPALEHDRVNITRGRPIPPHGYVERRIVAAMFHFLYARGFACTGVWDGEEFHPCCEVIDPLRATKAMMEVIFNLDEVSVRFAKRGGVVGTRNTRHGFNAYATGEHGVLLVLGNGQDCVSDWNYSKGDSDGFDAAMDAFTDLIHHIL